MDVTCVSWRSATVGKRGNLIRTTPAVAAAYFNLNDDQFRGLSRRKGTTCDG